VIDTRERVRKNAGDSPVLLQDRAGFEPYRARRRRPHARSRKVDGMIVANTTLARPSTLRETNRRRRGRLSGRRCSGCRRGWWRKPMCARRRVSACRRWRHRYRRRRADKNPRRRQPDSSFIRRWSTRPRPGRGHQTISPRRCCAPGATRCRDCRRRCRDDYGRGLRRCSEVHLARLRGEVGLRSNPVRGTHRASVFVEAALTQPSPRKNGEREIILSERLLQQRRITPGFKAAARGVVHQ